MQIHDRKRLSAAELENSQVASRFQSVWTYKYEEHRLRDTVFLSVGYQ